VLEAVAAGRSPWHGWDKGTAANTYEGQDAYRRRAEVITECRDHGLMTAENLLTDKGRKVLQVVGVLHG
jgi:hypothetical protein